MAILSTKITRSIEEISHQDWNAVFPSVLEGYNFFKTIDESNFEGFSFYYILVYENGKPVGAASCFLMDYAIDTTTAISSLLDNIRKRFPRIFKMKMLMCGLVVGEGRIGIGGEDRKGVLRTIVKAMDDIAKETRAPILVFKDFSEEYRQDLVELLNDGFCRFRGFPVAELDIHFKSFDDYLMSLSHRTRKDLRRKFKIADTLPKIDLRISNDLGDYLQQAYKLYLWTFSNSRVHFELVPQAFFKNVSKNMPPETRYFMWFIDNRLVAFNLCLTSGDILIGEYVGFDYSLAHEHHLYFVRSRDVTTYCIENGIKKYYTGATDYEPKKRLGSKIIPLYTYVKHRNRLLNPILKIVCKFLSPHDFDKNLKSSAKEDY